MAPTAPPRYQATVESPEQLAEHASATSPVQGGATAPPPPQGEVELLGRADDSLLAALVEMHNPTRGDEAGGRPPASGRVSARMMENP
jgi:hypothetical protein